MKHVGRSAPTEHFVCVDGEGRGPVEDSIREEGIQLNKAIKGYETANSMV